MIRLFMLCAAVILLCAPFFAPYTEDEQNRSRAQENPTPIHMRGARPVILEAGQTYPIRFFTNGHLFGVPNPARIFLFGTDEYGRDIFSRFLFGGRVSLAGGMFATLLALTLGLTVGAVAGLGFGWLDELLMRISELFVSLPWLFLLLALRAILPLQLSTSAAFWLVTPSSAYPAGPAPLASFAAWSSALKKGPTSKSHVRSAQAPSTFSVTTSCRNCAACSGHKRFSSCPQFVLADMALSFLGLGAGEPSASWGGMLASSAPFLRPRITRLATGHPPSHDLFLSRHATP